MALVCLDPLAMFNGAEKLQHLSVDLADRAMSIDRGRPSPMPHVDGEADSELSLVMMNGAYAATEQYGIALSLLSKGVELQSADGVEFTPEEVLIMGGVLMGGKSLYDGLTGRLTKPFKIVDKTSQAYATLQALDSKFSKTPPKSWASLGKTLEAKKYVTKSVLGSAVGVVTSAAIVLSIDRYITDPDVKLNMLDEYEDSNLSGDFGPHMQVAMGISQAMSEEDTRQDMKDGKHGWLGMIEGHVIGWFKD